MRTDQDRRIPVETFGFFVLAGLRFDVDHLAGLAVPANEVSLLPFGIDDVGIGGIDRRLVSVAEQRDLPIPVTDPVHVVGS